MDVGKLHAVQHYPKGASDQEPAAATSGKPPGRTTADTLVHLPLCSAAAGSERWHSRNHCSSTSRRCHCTGWPTACARQPNRVRVIRPGLHTPLHACCCCCVGSNQLLGMETHQGSVGCRSTPLTRSVRCTSCFCTAHNRNDSKQTEGNLCERAGPLLDSTAADQKCRVAGMHARLAREGTRQGGGWKTADDDLGPLTFTSSRNGCATG